VKSQIERFLDYAIRGKPIAYTFRAKDFSNGELTALNTLLAPSFVEIDGLRLALGQGEEATVYFKNKDPETLIGLGAGVRVVETPRTPKKDLFDGLEVEVGKT